MAESSLSLTYAQLKAAAGLFLGYGRGVTYGDATWTTRQSSILDEIVKSGLRQFYFPAPTEKNGVSYEWSFLRPSAELTLDAAASSVNLPDDFGGFDGTLQVSSDESTTGFTLELTGMGRIRLARAAQPDSTGRPLIAAVDPIKGATLTEGQRFALEVFPTADVEYTLACCYYVHPDALSGTAPYAYGGLTHAETIMAAINAAAELYLDDTKSVRKEFFMERLQVSMSLDRRLKPQVQGYNGDASNRKRAGRWDRWHGAVEVTYNGQTPT